MKNKISFRNLFQDSVCISSWCSLVCCLVIRASFHDCFVENSLYDVFLVSGGLLFCKMYLKEQRVRNWGAILSSACIVLSVLLEELLLGQRSVFCKKIMSSLILLGHGGTMTVKYLRYFNQNDHFKKEVKGYEVAHIAVRFLLESYYLILSAMTFIIVYDQNSCMVVSSIVLFFFVVYYLMVFFRQDCLATLPSSSSQNKPKSKTKTSRREPAGDGGLQGLCERFTRYMQEKQPYLNDNCQVEDIARALYTNKTYLSNMFRQCLGSNFSTVINQYRVEYSIELYKKDMHLKVSELAEMSGFHSCVTYNVAFKLMMNETPSEWCRKVRNAAD